MTYNQYNDKKLLINNLNFLEQYQETHTLYFVTITFKQKSKSFNEGLTFKKSDYSEYFRLFNNRLNSLSLRHSKQRNKCAFIAFPETSYFTQKRLWQDEIITLNQNRQKSTFRGLELPPHYHSILMIPNQHKDRFKRKCVDKAVGKKFKLSWKLHYPYPKTRLGHPDNLIVQDTDIQTIDNLEGVINYASKGFLTPDFDYDDMYIYVSKNSMREI